MGIMTALGGLIGGATATGVTEMLNGVGDAALKAREAITGQLSPEKQAEFDLKMREVDARLSEAQNKVNEIEASSVSFFVAGWRPATGWICTIGFGYAAIIQPVFTWACIWQKWPAPPAVDSGALITMLTGMLGLGGFRSYEKTQGVHNDH